MYISEKTLDDLMHVVLEKLLILPFNIKTSRGNSSEIIGALLRLENPRARLSRTETKGTPFSALGELLWYLSKNHDLEFIKFYIQKYEKESEDGKTIYGGYGPRLFNFRDKYDQIDNIIKLLSKRKTSRKAVIQLFDAQDLAESHPEMPCTCTLQFMIRDEKLQMYTSMRSNDAFIGLPHDIFAFTMIQEIIARTLGVEMGLYIHSVGSLHLYEDNIAKANQYLKEGYQTTNSPMPPMPHSNPWETIAKLLDMESKIRNFEELEITKLNMDPYWKDLLQLLEIHALFKQKDYEGIKKMQKNLSNNIYNVYIEKRLALAQQ